MEKLKPHYDLASIKATFATVGELRMTRTAQDSVLALGFLLQDVVDMIQRMTRAQFYKSMTNDFNSAIWQDVYHVNEAGIVLYVKFTTDASSFLLISFKEK